MGEIDTKPIESVQVGISLFGERKDSPAKSCQELEKQKEVESLLKDLATLKVQLEAKDLAYKHVLHKLDHYQKSQDELSTLLKNSDSVKIKYIDECKESNLHINLLESTIKEMSDKLQEFDNIQKQLSHVTDEHMTCQGRVLNMETQIDGLRRAKVESKMQVEAMETDLREEKMKNEELLKNITQLNESISNMQIKAQVKTETQLAQVECKDNSSVIVDDFEKQPLEKSILADVLQLELEQASEMHSCSQTVTHITSLETQLEETKIEFRKADEEIESMRTELEKIREEMNESTERDTAEQVEIALLKSKLHEGRSKLAAVEAAEARAQMEKSALYHAVQELALEAEEAKKENRELKELIKLASGSKSLNIDEEHLTAEHEETEGEVAVHVTISRKEYEALIEKAEQADQVSEPMNDGEELKNLQKELDAATMKIKELRTRAEQAISRAEAAEKVKVEFEEQKRRWKEHKEKRKAALAELREESNSKDYNGGYKHDNVITEYQPLGKVLNMKF